MKKLFTLSLLLMLAISVYPQKKNGTVYQEHPSIEKVKQFWAALSANDPTTYMSFLADTVVVNLLCQLHKRQTTFHV